MKPKARFSLSWCHYLYFCTRKARSKLSTCPIGVRRLPDAQEKNEPQPPNQVGVSSVFVLLYQYLPSQYLYFCTSKAGQVSTFRMRINRALKETLQCLNSALIVPVKQANWVPFWCALWAATTDLSWCLLLSGCTAETRGSPPSETSCDGLSPAPVF